MSHHFSLIDVSILMAYILLTLYIGVKELKCHKPVVGATALLLVTTFVGNGYEYRSIMYKQAYKSDYPDWRTELVEWKKSPTYQINICLQPGK